MARRLLQVGVMRSLYGAQVVQGGSTSHTWGNVDEGWSSIADEVPALPPPPKPADWSAELETGMALPGVERASRHAAGFVVSQAPRSIIRPVAADVPADWRRGERRLWLAAGTLMVLAACVLSVLAVLTFGGSAPAPVVATPAPSPAPAPVVAAAEPARVDAAPASVEKPKAHKRAHHKKRVSRR